MGMSIGASMGMQLAGKVQNGTVGSLIREYDKLSQQKSQIEHNQNYSKEEKAKKLQQIEQQMDQLQQQISQAEQKDNAKQQMEKQQREQQKLEDTLPPKVADMVMQMNKMMKTAMNVDSAQSNPQDASEEIKADNSTTTPAANTTDATNNAELTANTVATGNTIANKNTGTADNTSTAVKQKSGLQKTAKEQLTDMIEQIREENEKASDLEKIPEGLLVDEYR
jgi:hypothetical protein